MNQNLFRIDLVKSRSRLEAENAALGQQLAVLQRRVHGRVQLTNSDRLFFFVFLYRLSPSVLKAMTIVRPETVVRWHRAGFRAYWRWRSGNPGGPPPDHSRGAGPDQAHEHREPSLGRAAHSREPLKVGFVLAQSTVAKYMVKRNGPLVRTGARSLRNHAPYIAISPP